MLYLLRKQVAFIIIFFVMALGANAQYRELNRPGHDEWPYYFGLSLSYNNSYLHPDGRHPRFVQDDSVWVAEPGSGGGIGLGLLATLKLSNRFEARVNPQLIIGGARTFTYVLGKPALGEPETVVKTLPSTIVSFPFQLKFNSDRINNFRVYMMGGVKADIDLASNSKARNAEDLIKLKKGDFGYEVGMGFNFYFKFVTFSPELKISNGLGNVHNRDANLKYSSVFDKLQTRMIVFSVILED